MKQAGSRESKERLHLRGKYLQWTAYGLLILLVFLIQSAPHMMPTILGVRPLLLVLMPVCIGMFVGPVGGGAAGVVCGLLIDLYAAHLFGIGGLMLLVVGTASGLAIQLLLRNNLLTAWLLGAGALVLYETFNWLIFYALPRTDGLWAMLLTVLLPQIVYSLVLLPLLYGATMLTAKVLRNRE